MAPPSSPPPLPPRTHFGVVYHGAFYRAFTGERSWNGNDLCSDFFANEANHRAQFFEPLRRWGADAHVVFHTFESGCAARDAALVAALNPVAHRIAPAGSTERVVDSYIIGLNLLKEWAQANGRTVDYVVLTRFDVVYRAPFTRFNIGWDRVNFPWVSMPIDGLTTTSDLFHVLPYANLDDMTFALDWSGKSPPARGIHGAAHWAFDPIRERMGPASTSFIATGVHESWEDIAASCDVPMSDLFLGIHRHCPDPSCAGVTDFSPPSDYCQGTPDCCGPSFCQHGGAEQLWPNAFLDPNVPDACAGIPVPPVRVCDNALCQDVGGDCCAPWDEAKVCGGGFEVVHQPGDCWGDPNALYTCCEPVSPPSDRRSAAATAATAARLHVC